MLHMTIQNLPIKSKEGSHYHAKSEERTYRPSREERRIYLPEERGLGKRERERDAPAKQPTKIEGRW